MPTTCKLCGGTGKLRPHNQEERLRAQMLRDNEVYSYTLDGMKRNGRTCPQAIHIGKGMMCGCQPGVCGTCHPPITKRNY